MINALRKFVRKNRDLRQVAALKREWMKIIRSLPEWRNTQEAELDVLLIPPEPMSLIGSKGDEAMLVSVISSLAKSGRSVDVAVGSHWQSLPPALRAAGAVNHLPIWEYTIDLSTALGNISRYKEIILIGADVMDGYYSASKSYRFLMIADIAARLGKKASITGFSFNAKPAPSMKELAFQEYSREVRLCLRDPVSFSRFSEISGGLGVLTADVAFLLAPDEESTRLTDVRAWAEGRREVGDFILGFNIHPALLPADSVAMTKLVEASISALRELITSKRVSVLLVSHDSRATSSDSLSLKPIFDSLSVELSENVRFVEADHSAAELKAVAGLADSVFTGRMHLSIAALGMGVPVGWATYQGKFEGLAQHFGLPEWLLLDPATVSRRPELLVKLLERMIAEQPALKHIVTARLPDIKKLAALNLPASAASAVKSHE